MTLKEKWASNKNFREVHTRQSLAWYNSHKDDPEFKKRRGAASKKRYVATKSTPEYKFDYYKRASSGRRKIAFELTFDQFMSFWQKPCSYCKDPIATIGLDRIDNASGYTFGNVASCCRTCNVMKQQMSHSQFIAHVKKILS